MVIYSVFWSGTWCICCTWEMRTSWWVTLSRVGLNWEPWLFFVFVLRQRKHLWKPSWNAQKQYCHNLFPEYLRLQVDVLVIIILVCYSPLSVGQWAVVTSLCLCVCSVLLYRCFYVIIRLSLCLYNWGTRAIWISHKYMLQQCALLI